MMKRFAQWLVSFLVIGALLWAGVCAFFITTRPTLAFTPGELARPPEPLPPGFLWGTATAAHQIEGGHDNDWTRFESVPGNIEGGARSTIATDHWNRMGDDVALMQALGANAYRFSIEWSRLEPEEGAWNEEAWAHYQELLRRLDTLTRETFDAAVAKAMNTISEHDIRAWVRHAGYCGA